jgi:uncharacterized protein
MNVPWPIPMYRPEERTMQREKALQKLSDNMSEIRERFGVEYLGLFGSIARDEAGPESDIDILVEFKRVPGLFGFLDLKEYLEGVLGRPVDLVTVNALKKQLREQILREVVRAQ